jgi:hypothetical protein
MSRVDRYVADLATVRSLVERHPCAFISEIGDLCVTDSDCNVVTVQREHVATLIDWLIETYLEPE